MTVEIEVAFIGAASALIGAAAGVGGSLWVQARSVVSTFNLEVHRMQLAREGVRRELYGRLRMLASHLATYRRSGIGQNGELTETIARLNSLMSSSDGPACLPSDELTMRVYDLLSTAQLMLQTITNITKRETAIAESSVLGLASVQERMGIHISSAVVSTISILRQILDQLQVIDLLRLLDAADSEFDVRMALYAERVSPAQNPSPPVSEV